MSRRLLTLVVAVAALLSTAPAARAEWVWPVEGAVITPYRNGDDPYAAGQHRGIDIGAPVGATVVAASGGSVRFAGTAGSSGLTVSIRTADRRLDTSYLHLSSTAVRKGDQVATGERIGAVGTTGKRSAVAPHLHFGIRDAGTRHVYRDPLTLLPPSPATPERPGPEPPPSPIPFPVAPSPEPAPSGWPSHRAAPRAQPSHRAAPHREPRALPSPSPRRQPSPTRQPAPAPVLIPNSRRVPSLRPKPAPHLGPVPGANLEATGRPSLTHLAAPDPATRRGPEANGAPPAPSERPGAAPGPDLAYIAACLGLLLAAAILGLTEDGRQATKRSRARFVTVLRPLLGRRL